VKPSKRLSLEFVKQMYGHLELCLKYSTNDYTMNYLGLKVQPRTQWKYIQYVEGSFLCMLNYNKCRPLEGHAGIKSRNDMRDKIWLN